MGGKTGRLAAAVLAAGILPACLEDLKSTGGFVLSAPAGLAGAALGDGTAVDLSWADTSTGETGFRVEVAPVPIVSDADITEYAIVPSNGVSYRYPAAPGLTRYFRVAAFTSFQQSPWSNVASVTTPDVPLAPANLTAHVGPSSDVVAALSWGDLGNETGYDVERSANGGPWGPLVSLGANVVAHTDPTTSYDTEYGYRVRGTNADGAGAWSDVALTQTRTTSWRASSVSSSTDVSWFTSIAVASGGSANAAHYDADAGAVWISSVSDFGASGGPIHTSQVVAGYTGTSLARDGAGTLHVVANANDNSFGMTISYFASSTSWTQEVVVPGASSADRARLAVGTGNEPHVIYQQGTQLRHAWRNGGSWPSEPVIDNVPDYFGFTIDGAGRLQVIARRPILGGHELVHTSQSGGGPWSSTVIPTNGTPEFCSIAADAAGNAHVAYNELTTYGLSYATNAGGTWTSERVHLTRGGSWGRYNAIAVDPTTGRVHVSYSDMLYENLRYASKDPGGSWRLRLLDGLGVVGRFTSIGVDAQGRVFIAYGDSSNLDLKVVRNLPATPQNVLASPFSPTRIDVTWTPAPGATSYRVERSSDGGGSWTAVGTPASASFADTTVTGSLEYAYRVFAVNESGESAASGSSSTIPVFRRDVAFAPSSSFGIFPSIDVAPDGTEHVAHGDGTNTNILYTTGAPGGPYATITADSGTGPSSAVAGISGALDRDAAGVIHIGGQLVDSFTQDLRYATVTGGVPSAATVETAGVIGLNTCLKAAPDGTVHAAHLEQLSGGWTYRHSVRSVGGVWSSTAILPNTPIIQVQSSLFAVDDLSRPHLAYVKFVSGVTSLDYGIKAGPSWTFATLGGAVDPSDVALTTDASNVPHLVYRDTSGRLHYGTNASGSWVFTPIPGASGGFGPSIAVHSPTGRIHVAFALAGLRYARKDPSGAWVVRTLDATISVGNNQAVAVDAAGAVHIAYRNESTNVLRILSGTP